MLQKYPFAGALVKGIYKDLLLFALSKNWIKGNIMYSWDLITSGKPTHLPPQRTLLKLISCINCGSVSWYKLKQNG